jgi:hypothetical protein
MAVIKITGNTITLNSTPTVVPLSNTYLANSTQGASCVYIFNANTTTPVTLTIANSQGNNTFTVPPNVDVVLIKQPSDALTASANLIANPIAKEPN